MTQNVVLDV